MRKKILIFLLILGVDVSAYESESDSDDGTVSLVENFYREQLDKVTSDINNTRMRSFWDSSWRKSSGVTPGLLTKGKVVRISSEDITTVSLENKELGLIEKYFKGCVSKVIFSQDSRVVIGRHRFSLKELKEIRDHYKNWQEDYTTKEEHNQSTAQYFVDSYLKILGVQR